MKSPVVSYAYYMKKVFSSLMLIVAMLPALAACGGYDYTAHISESRCDLFLAETEDFTVSLSCVKREYPYASDGIACPVSTLVEISLVPAQKSLEDYAVYYVYGGAEVGGDASFRSFAGDYFYSQSVKEFPQKSVTIKIVCGDETQEIAATSVRNEKTLSPEEIVRCAVKAEEDTVKRMMRNGTFTGEFYVRLLRRKSNFYYVGIIDGEGKTISLLLDSETGKVLARRES